MYTFEFYNLRTSLDGKTLHRTHGHKVDIESRVTLKRYPFENYVPSRTTLDSKTLR